MKPPRSYIDDRPQDGVFRVHRDVYVDPELFEMEQRFIFERTWNFLAHESQLPNPHDFYSTSIGRVPVLLMRDQEGRLGAFLNACRHKGAMLTRVEAGNRKHHVCPYHAWGYRSDGTNAGIKDVHAGAYAAGFAAESHDLVRIANLGEYRGFIFGSLSADVPPLDEYLGSMRFFMDLAIEQGDGEMEFVPGRVAFVFNANWKLQMDNGLDFYHLTSTHTSMMDIMRRRESGQGYVDARSFTWDKRQDLEAGSFHFPHGHAAVWQHQPEASKRPVFSRMDALRKRLGDVKAEWVLKVKNSAIFPNMQMNDGTSLLVRIARPLAVDRTEMRYWCLAPKNDTPAQRSWRLRQFEDFFNASGFATPDDSVVYEDCQRGYAARPMGWLQGFQRAMAVERPGRNREAEETGIDPVSTTKGPFALAGEVCFHPLYREWVRLMEAGLAEAEAHAHA
jgi:benzoate/toluate 1,2-dioxygenase subunit alpha